MQLTIADNPEDIGYLTAKKLLADIKAFKPTEEKGEFLVGLSSGRTMDRVFKWFVELVKKEGQGLDLSSVRFIQTEAFYPEDPNSDTSIMARQIREKFVLPLESLLQQKVNIYYPGAESDIDTARKKFVEFTKHMDIDFVTLHESGAAKGLRDADLVSGEMRWSQGRMQTREIQLRPIEDVRAGELIRESMDRFGSDRPLDEVLARVRNDVSAKDKNLTPKFFISEGYWAYKNAGKVLIITEGENKSVGLKRVLESINQEGKRQKDLEGTVSGTTVVDLRSGENTEFIVDRASVSLVNLEFLKQNGVEISEFKRGAEGSDRELGSEFSWPWIKR